MPNNAEVMLSGNLNSVGPSVLNCENSVFENVSPSQISSPAIDPCAGTLDQIRETGDEVLHLAYKGWHNRPDQCRDNDNKHNIDQLDVASRRGILRSSQEIMGARAAASVRPKMNTASGSASKWMRFNAPIPRKIAAAIAVVASHHTLENASGRSCVFSS